VTVDQPAAGLVTDLKQRGLLDDTLVIFGTEFGRTSFAQGALKGDYGRDHHGGNFSVWMAGGGVKGGLAYGETDEFCYNIVKDPVHIHDFNATIMRTLGIDHTKLTFRAQGRDFRLTDVAGKVVTDLLA
jgi:arylsulfatase A-like enzyme